MKTGTNRAAILWSIVCALLLLGHCGKERHDADRFSVLFAGDTSYGENYQADRARAGRANILEEEGYDYSLAGLDPLLRASDQVVVNLETPITDLPRSPLTGKRFIHWSDVERAPAGLRRHGVDAVSLANNHAMDFGAAGLAQTLRVLSGVGIECFGAGASEAEAARAWRRDIRLGETTVSLRVVGAMMYEHGLERHGFYARGERAGVHALVEKKLLAQVRALREAEPDALVVVFPHWGRNYEWNDRFQERIGRGLIDAGADLVLGHGAHMLQAIERYRGRWIAYGIGNFMFNSVGRFDKLDAPPYSLPVRLLIERGEGGPEARLRFYPIFSDNTKTRFRPRLVTRPEFGKVVALLAERSRDPELFDRHTEAGEDTIGSYLEVRLEWAR